ncbi:MAG: peptidylprolyl isomerase [Bacillota bacterium]
MKKIILLLSSIAMMTILIGCADTPSDESTEETAGDTLTFEAEQTNFYDTYPEVTDNPVATIELTTDETIQLELYPNTAPNTVANFISLAETGFYDGVIFHRIIKDFMIQGGDPLGNGLGGPDYSIPGEFESNGFDNDLLHEPGVISMARSQSPDSAGSQFFIMHKTSTHLDGEYAGFGKVIEGMDVVNKLATTETDQNDAPVEEQQIETITVDTKGVDYPDPLKK